MQLVYGGVAVGPAGQALITAETEVRWNAGGQPYSQVRRLHVRGDLLTTVTSGNVVAQQLDLTLQENALRTLLSVNFRDLVFLNDDGSVSSEALLNAGSITGVRILSLSFPESKGPQLATIRTYALTAEAEYPLANTAALLLSFRETLSFGGGLPTYAFRLALNGPPQKQQIWPATPFTCTQEGEAVGYLGYPVPPGPLFPASLLEAPQVRQTSPERKGPLKYQAYPVTWHYSFADSGPLSAAPTLWVN